MRAHTSYLYQRVTHAITQTTPRSNPPPLYPFPPSTPLPHNFQLFSRSFILPTRIQSARSKRKERVHKDHMPPRLRLQGKRSCSHPRDYSLSLSLSYSYSLPSSPRYSGYLRRYGLSRFEQICVKMGRKSGAPASLLE